MGNSLCGSLYLDKQLVDNLKTCLVTGVARAFRCGVDSRVKSGIYNLGSGISSSIEEVLMFVEQEITGKTEIRENNTK